MFDLFILVMYSIFSTPTCRNKVMDNPLYIAPDTVAEIASIKDKVMKEDKDDDNSSDRDY